MMIMSTLHMQVISEYLNEANNGQLKEKGIISIVCQMKAPIPPQILYTTANSVTDLCVVPH
jgi:hypothetical protein